LFDGPDRAYQSCKGVVTQCGSSKSRARSSARKFCLRVEKKEKEMLSKILRGAVLATFAVGATVAQADPFGGTPVGTPPGTPGTLKGTAYSNASMNVDVTTPPWGGGAGQFQGYFDPDGATGTSDFFRFFCLELTQSFSFGSVYNYTRYEGVRTINSSTDRPVDTQNNKELTYLYDLFYPSKSTGNFSAGPSSVFGNFTSTKDSVAMQLAIWNIWYDTDFTLNGGNFHWGTSQLSAEGIRANEMLGEVKAALEKSSKLSGEWTLYHFVNDANQNFLSATYASGDPPNRIPLPGTLALFGIGLAGLGLARRKS
jgi:hypothetical protein